ncbi:MAG: hypothetical protein HKN67_05455 [Saprospiraceae bacterium]|nr:hypothetical protein [Saprospiraceae bacterium]
MRNLFANNKKIPSFVSEMSSKIACIFILIFFVNLNCISAQGHAMDFFRSTGKINTVLAVVVLLFLVVIFFLLRLEIKLNNLEKTINDEEQTG